MPLTRLKLENYGPFHDATEAEFGPGINVVVGTNNAGKSCLLTAIRGAVKGNPHRSLATKPNAESWSPAPSKINYEYEFDKAGFWRMVESWSGTTVDLPLGQQSRDNPRRQQLAEAIVKHANWKVQWVEVAQEGKTSTLTEEKPGLGITHPQTIENQQQQGGHATITVESGKAPQLSSSRNGGFAGGNHVQWTAAYVRGQTVWLDAQRPSIGVCPSNRPRDQLSNNGSNLPVLLADLQGNALRYQRFVKIVREILPEISHVSVNADQNEARILVWFHDPESERTDLCFPLDDCGSGTAQVILMAYSVLENQVPQTIIIDEPQSFLHPSALRSMMSVLQRHGKQHQFILTTHSSHVIAAASPDQVILVRRKSDHSSSELVNMDTRKAEEARAIALETGVRMSDVFGAETVLWVEGPTEELAFEYIINGFVDVDSRFVRVLAVHSTGALSDSKSKKQRQAAIELHNRIANGGALLPSSVAFLLDAELRTEDEKKDLAKLGGKAQVHFLSRRMLENYTLNAEAIAACLEENHATKISASEIQEMLDSKQKNGAGRPQAERKDQEGWLEKTDAAAVLKQIIEEKGPDGAEFKKTRDTAYMVRWLAEHDPSALKPLIEDLAKAPGGQAIAL